jgi:hypothetical protein
VRGLALDPAELARLRQEVAHARHKRRQPLARYTRAYVRRFGAVVRQGPFAGLRYTRRGVAMAEDVVAKLLGSYERELFGVLEEAIARRPPVVVNVGAGEGYYAVGVARRSPGADVVAFEIDPLRRLWCRKMAGANGVGGQVELRGGCDPAELERALAGRPSLVICDCEGAEAEVIVPALTPSLTRAFLVIEVHDFVSELIGPTLVAALEPTHALQWILAEPRWRDDYPELAQVPGFGYMEHDLAVSEFRPRQMRWLVARPMDSGSAPGLSPNEPRHRP